MSCSHYLLLYHAIKRTILNIKSNLHEDQLIAVFLKANFTFCDTRRVFISLCSLLFLVVLPIVSRSVLLVVVYFRLSVGIVTRGMTGPLLRNLVVGRVVGSSCRRHKFKLEGRAFHQWHLERCCSSRRRGRIWSITSALSHVEQLFCLGDWFPSSASHIQYVEERSRTLYSLQWLWCLASHKFFQVLLPQVSASPVFNRLVVMGSMGVMNASVVVNTYS